MPQVTVKKVKTLSGDNFYRVYVGTDHVVSYYFIPGNDHLTTCSEAKAREQAMERAAEIENYGAGDSEEIIYQTPEKP